MLIVNPSELEIFFNNGRQVVVWVLSRNLARRHGWKRLFSVAPTAQRGHRYIVPYSIDIDLDSNVKRQLSLVVETKAIALFGGRGIWPSFSCGVTVSEMQPARFKSLFQTIRIKNKAGSNQSRFEFLYGAADDYDPRPCDKPTDTAPGSEERIAVYRKRLERGVSLYHPEDRVLDVAVASD